MMDILHELVTNLPEGKILNVQIGIFWTVVVAETGRGIHAGLSATQVNRGKTIDRRPVVAAPGRLAELSARELAALVLDGSVTEQSVGMAAINALIGEPAGELPLLNAEDYLMREGQGKKIAVIGHFPFVEAVRQSAAEVWVLELNPQPGDLPASAAAEVLPQADLVAITATTLLNGTFAELIGLCRPGSKRMLLGPTTPLSPLLFARGLDVLCGSLVEDLDLLLSLVTQGANMRQISKAGAVRFVTMGKS